MGEAIPLDKYHWSTNLRVYDFHDPKGKIAMRSRAGENLDKLTKEFKQDFLGIYEKDHNVGCNTGIGEMMDLIFGLGTPTAFSAANTYLGVGDGNGSLPTVAATDTVLAASTNKAYVVMDGTFPSRSGQTVTLQATFGAGVGTWTWREIAIRNASSEAGGKQLNHMQYDKGTKGALDTSIPVLQLTFA